MLRDWANSYDVQISCTHPLPFISLDLTGQLGEVNWIKGPSGSGKTSLLRAIAGLDRAEQAHIRFGNHLWQTSAPPVFEMVEKRQLSFLFQSCSLLPHLTVVQHIEYARHRSINPLSWASIEQQLQQLDLQSLLQHKTNHLSGGERQRLAFICSLAINPLVMFFDEPFTALDARYKKICLDLLLLYVDKAKKTVFYVTHDASEIESWCQHVVNVRSANVAMIN
jgi:molybdate transport system ATP-binding protein